MVKYKRKEIKTKNKELVDILNELKKITPEIKSLNSIRKRELLKSLILLFLGVPSIIIFGKYAKYQYSKPIEQIISKLLTYVNSWGFEIDQSEKLSFIDWLQKEFKETIQPPKIIEPEIIVRPVQRTWVEWWNVKNEPAAYSVDLPGGFPKNGGKVLKKKQLKK